MQITSAFIRVNLRLLSRPEEGGEAEQVVEHTCGCDLWTSAGSSDDHRLNVVAGCLKTHAVVAAAQVCEGVIQGISTQTRGHLPVAVDRAHVSQHLSFKIGRAH